MLGKRGLSPLIATILLIGFAVALGVMIMGITQPLVKNSCDEVNIKTATFCKEGGKLFAFVTTDKGNTVCRNIVIDTGAIDVTCPA